MPDRYIADLAGTLRNQFRIQPAATSGPPVSGYHGVGELHMDSAGSVWSCVVAGTPGTWERLETVVTGQAPSLPVSTTVLDSLAIATYRTVKWSLELRKGTTKSQVQEIVATHDDTTPTDQRPVSFKTGTGTIDISATVDISGGNLRLTVTPSSTGWTATWRRLYAMGA